MARPLVNRIGQTFGRLTVMAQERDGDSTYALCRCECGRETRTRMASLTGGSTRSCGCLVAETRASPIIDRVGQRFGRLVVQRLGEGRTAGGGVRWWCLCDCGTEKVINGNSLAAGNSRSCGCLHRDAVHRTHGASGTKEYRAWAQMKSRCNDPANARFSDYGGRGISVCERWAKFETFMEDLGPRPDGCSLDRIDNDGNYEPGNVRWATGAEQAANKRPIIRHRDMTSRSIAHLGALGYTVIPPPE